MTSLNLSFNRKKSAGAILAALFTTIFPSPVRAEKIRWAELQQRPGPDVQHRGIDVITFDGQKHSARRMQIDAKAVKLYYSQGKMETLPRAGIVRIEIRQAGRFFHHISESASIPVEVGRLGCDPVLFGLLFTVTSPAWAYSARKRSVFPCRRWNRLLRPTTNIQHCALT